MSLGGGNPGRPGSRYVFTDVIAQSSNTKVVKATLPNSTQIFACKIISYEGKSENFVQRAREEANLLQELNGHPNIIRTYEIFEENNNMYLIMEYIDCDLLTFLGEFETGLSEEKAFTIFKQLRKTLSFLHKKLIVHGDIKLENLLYNRLTNQVVMIDFGSASRLTKKSQYLDILTGTPQYVAPEVVIAENYDGFQSDVYSLGVVLFALVTNRLPFDDEDGVYYYSWVENFGDALFGNNERMLPPILLSLSLKCLLQKMLALNPQTRIKLSKIKHQPWFRKRDKNTHNLYKKPSLHSWIFLKDRKIRCDANSSIPETF